MSAKKKSHHGGSLKSCASRASHAPLYHPFALYTQYANTALPYAVRLCELKGKSFTGDERAVARGSERSATSERALQLRCLSLLHMCIHASHAHMQHAHCTCDMHMARHSSDESRITHEKRERTPTLSLTRFLRLEYSGPPRLFWRGSLAWRPCPHRGHRGCPRSRRRSRAPGTRAERRGAQTPNTGNGDTLLGGGEARSSANTRLTRPNTRLAMGPAGWLPTCVIATAASKAASSRSLCDLRSSAVAAAVVDSVAKPSAARLARTFPVALIQQGHDPARRVDEQIRELDLPAARNKSECGRPPVVRCLSPLQSIRESAYLSYKHALT